MHHQYLYDSLYNRRRQDDKEHTINSLNQLLSQDRTSYSYNARGNLTEENSPDTSAQYSYDALGRLTSLTRNGQRYEYQYDAFNRRTHKQTPQGEERYLYIDQNEIGMANEQGQILQLRILGSGKGAEIGSAVALELNGQTYIPYHDHAGHLSALIHLQTNQLAERSTYTAFGEEKREGNGVSNPWHFSSKRLDPESGWIYFGRRYYDPHTGRWTTPDPIGFADGANLYAYVHNSPLTHFDLYGLASVPPPLSGASSGVSSGQTSHRPLSASSKSASRRTLPNSGVGSRKWDWSGRDERPYSHSRAGITVAPRFDSHPGVGLKESPGHGHPECFIGCPTDEAVDIDSCLVSTTVEYCGVTLRTDTSSPSAFGATSSWTIVEVSPHALNLGWAGPYAIKEAICLGRLVYLWVGRSATHESPTIADVKSSYVSQSAKTDHKCQTPLGGKITGYTRHGLNQAIGRDDGKGVGARWILDAVKKPQKVIPQSGGRVKYVGRNATVILDSQGRIITLFGKPRGPRVWDRGKVIQPPQKIKGKIYDFSSILH